MFGKHGRGGGSGRGSVKRPLSGTVQLQRPVVVGGSRPPIGVSAAAARARHGAPGAPAATAASATGREETFSLEPGELDFGAIIRLTPDLVDEIRRLEAQGGSTRIKFDSNANNSAGNVIDVGGKEFRFTWSREPTDLCDIYEERQNGEDGDGLLVECGSAWRKLNVQRILDESTKNHVKMRSEEAERLLKSRKAIVLDPTNPSVKNQAKSMVAAAVEGNMRRMSWKHKKEMFFKKRKVEPNQGAVTVAQPKSIFKSTTASNGIKGIQSSPGPSPPQQPIPHTSLSPAGPGNTLRGDANPGEIPPLNINKEEIEIFEKGRPARVARSSMQEINGYKGGTTDPPIDLQSMLRTLLSQNPKGMSLKALEKAVGEKTTNSMKKIENVLKNIATFQAPGRYFLKQEGQVECSKRTESGSSPECSNKHTPKTASVLSVKASEERLNQETELRSKYEEESDFFERIDIVQDTEDPLSVDGKAYDDSKLREGSSSESGSDSDSESDSSDSGSDSGSQSRSRSKSKSPAGSGSSSSSDSESDGSSSKEASDVDVDIMTSDDEKGVTMQRIETIEPRFSSSPRAWRFDGEHDVSDTNERDQKESTISPTLDLTDFESTYERAKSAADTKNLPIDRSAKSFENLEARTTVENIDSYLQKSKGRSSADGIDLPPNHNKVTENQHVSHFGDFDNIKDKIFEGKALNKEKNMMNYRTGYAQSDNHERVPKTNSKRSNSEYFQEKPEKAKRVKASSSAEAYFGKVKRASSSENSYYVSPEKSQHMDQTVKVNNNLQRDENRKIDLVEERPDEQAIEPSRHNIADSIVRKKAFDMEKPNKYVEILGRTNKHTEAICGSPESDAYAVKNKLVKDKMSAVKEKPDENGYTLAEYRTKNVKDSILGEKTSSAPEQVNRKSNEGYPSQLSNSDVNGKGNVLRRELSDLELGELREPPGDAMGEEDERQFERKNSFKKMENKVTVSDLHSDLNMGKCNENAVSESKKQSPPSSRGVNEKVLADDSIDLAQFQSRLVQPQSRQSARADFAGSTAMAQVDKCTELGGKNGMRTDQLVSAENQASEPKKSATNIVAKDNHRPQCLAGCKNVKDTKSTKSNGFKGSADQGSDGFLIDNGIDIRKCAEFSLDEENALYMKYEKEELDLRGPIMDFSKYKEYVQEYQEKYSHYCSLSKKLEKTRIDFLKVGDDIQLARGRDMKEYYSLVEKLRRMYHQCGDQRHKRMKKIFILLHEELKTLKQRIKDFADLHLGK